LAGLKIYTGENVKVCIAEVLYAEILSSEEMKNKVELL